MNIRTKWSILPVALFAMGTLAMAQSQSPAAQGSAGNSATQAGPLTAVGDPTLVPKDAGVYGEISGDASLGPDAPALLATTGVNQAIDSLSRAFANKDLEAFKQLWPSVPEKHAAALRKTFGYFKTISRNFKTEKIDVNGDTATVDGTYSGSFVNGATVIPSAGTFHAELKKVGSRWLVASLECK